MIRTLIAVAAYVATTALASPALAVDCERLPSAFQREACAAGTDPRAELAARLEAQTLAAGAALDGLNEYVRRGESVTATAPTIAVRPIGPGRATEAGRTFDGHAVGAQPQPGGSSCAASAETDGLGRPLAAGCLATDGILALKPGGAMYLQSFGDAMRVENLSGRAVPLPTCAPDEYASIARNGDLRISDACFSAVVLACAGTEGERAIPLAPLMAGESVALGFAGLVARCDGDAAWAVSFADNHECQAAREFFDTETGPAIGPDGGPVIDADGHQVMTELRRTKIGEQAQVLQAATPPLVRIAPDTSYIRVDGNYRGPGAFGANSCAVSANYSASHAYTPPGEVVRTWPECSPDPRLGWICPAESFCSAGAALTKLLGQESDWLAAGLIDGAGEGDNPSGLAVCLTAGGAMSTPRACPSGGSGVVASLEATPTAGLAACVVRGGYDPADDPLGPLPAIAL